MRKLLTAAMAGLVLVASQAAASSDSTVLRVGDRVGGESQAATQLEEISAWWLIAIATAVVIIVVIADDDGDEPASP